MGHNKQGTGETDRKEAREKDGQEARETAGTAQDIQRTIERIIQED